MTIHLDRIDAAPILGNLFEYPFATWLAVLVNVLNENLQDIEELLLQPISVTGTAQNVSLNSIYIPTNNVLTTFQMPPFCNSGDRLVIAGQGTGGWTLLNGSGQTIHLASTGATATTSISSSSQYDSIELICVKENLTWISLSTQTTGFIII